MSATVGTPAAMGRSATMGRSTAMGSPAVRAEVAPPTWPPAAVKKVEPEIRVGVIGRRIEIAGRYAPIFGIVIISGRTRVLGASRRGQHERGKGKANAQWNKEGAGQSSVSTYRDLREPGSLHCKALAVAGRHATAIWTWEEEAAARATGTSHRRSFVGCSTEPRKALRKPERIFSGPQHGPR